MSALLALPIIWILLGFLCAYFRVLNLWATATLAVAVFLVVAAAYKTLFTT